MTNTALYHLVRGAIKLLPDRVRRPIRPYLETILPRPDYYLVSYPKSGRTWLRFMIGTAILDHLGLDGRDPVDLDALSRASGKVPVIAVTHDVHHMTVALDDIRFRAGIYHRSRLLFLVRDPRDVLASFYYHQKYRRAYEANMPDFESADDMVEAKIGGLRSILRFYNVWAQNFDRLPGHLIVHYEDLKTDAAAELRRILEFLGLDDVSRDSIMKAIDAGQIEKMRESEKKGEFQSNFPPPDLSNINSFKVRRGKVGGYVKDFSKAAIERMDAIIASELSDDFARYKYRTDF